MGLAPVGLAPVGNAKNHGFLHFVPGLNPPYTFTLQEISVEIFCFFGGGLFGGGFAAPEVKLLQGFYFVSCRRQAKLTEEFVIAQTPITYLAVPNYLEPICLNEMINETSRYQPLL